MAEEAGLIVEAGLPKKILARTTDPPSRVKRMIIKRASAMTLFPLTIL